MTKHTSLFLVSLSSLKRARPTFLYPHQADSCSSMDLDDDILHKSISIPWTRHTDLLHLNWLLVCVSSIVTDNARRSAGEQEIIIPFLHPPFLSLRFQYLPFPHAGITLSTFQMFRNMIISQRPTESSPSVLNWNQTPFCRQNLQFSGDDELMLSMKLL